MPARFAPYLFALIVSGVVTLVISCVTTARVAGLGVDTIGHWMTSWLSIWPIAFPVVVVAGPAARKIVARLTKST